MSDKELLYNLIKETFLLLDDGDRRFFNHFDLTVSRYYALYHIGEEPGISFSQLSDCMVCDKSNVTRIIKGLESVGYVVRQPHETDGRTLRLYLTDEGTAVLNQIAIAHKSYIEARLNFIDEIEQDNLIEGLSRLNEHMKHDLYGLVEEIPL
ncbi:MAG: MarR family transcriptional regulator [Chloroflexota bacterium]|nr:MarR family transcriptional regulator [Anaerolineales bacterium]MCA9974822.1 MarR family transcriptional regulator [Anaerolineales bacterium]MCB8968752.1 MarR family transcriptional regulator [Ardenticatenaceae bacterium]